VGNFLMWGCIKRAMCNVNQLGDFGAFFSWLLRWEIFLTRDVVNKFYCIWYNILPELLLWLLVI
jgi:hypothetical protein